MTNTTYDLKPGYYWKIAPSTHPNRGAVLCLMRTVTSWAVVHEVAVHPLEHSPSNPEASIKKAMSRIKTHYPMMFADYTEEVAYYDKALKNITSSVAD